jgi:ubiquinone/menaquinone biosynthesis C-methylase UbiE
MQFANIQPVLTEIRRVLKSDGLIGFREVDLGASLYHSEDSALGKVLGTLREVILHNDGNPDVGRTLPSILHDASFELVSASATYACAATPEQKSGMYRAMERLWEQADFVSQAESLGLITERDRKEMANKLQQEATDPGSFSGTTYVEVVARKSRG